jgi:hypothetical protein
MRPAKTSLRGKSWQVFPKKTEADRSQSGIEHEGLSKAQYYRALLISAALAILSIISLIAVVEGIESGRPPPMIEQPHVADECPLLASLPTSAYAAAMSAFRR